MNLCPHKMNPISCPTCFRAKPPTPPAQQAPHIKPGIPMAPVMSVGEATIRATQGAARQRPTATLPNGQVREFKEPYSSARPPPAEAYGGEKQWEPSERQQVIDRQPIHPHVGEGKATVLKA